MTRKTLTLAVISAFAVAALVWAQSRDAAVYMEPGGDRQVVASGGSLDVESGGEIDIESGGSLKLAGTAISSTAAELNALDGITATVAELNILDGVTATEAEIDILDGSSLSTAELDEYVVFCEIADISTAASSWTVAPHGGDINKIWSVIDGAITVADATLSFELGGTAVTDGGITIAYSGSAAGTVDSATPSAQNTVSAGGAIECITDGGSTDAAKAVVALVISR